MSPEPAYRPWSPFRDFYRYFDATPHAEFHFRCVAETIEQDLPRETKFLASYDRLAAEVQEIVDLPQSIIDLLFRLLSGNSGKLSKRARSTEFSGLTEEEASGIEAIYAMRFEDPTGQRNQAMNRDGP